jgi:hypothetical protein
MQLGEPRKLPVTRCTACGKILNGVSALDEDVAPSPGDATICISCGHLMVFADDLMLRDLTDAEVIEWARQQGDR